MSGHNQSSESGPLHAAPRRRPSLARRLTGWSVVGVSTAAASFWAYWGILETFHEGWHQETLVERLAVMVGQYLSPLLAFTVAALVAVRWPRLGGLLHLGAAGFALWFFSGAAAAVLFPVIVLPLVLVGVGYWFGRPWPRSRACAVIVGVPLLVLVVCGAEPAWRVAHRHDDGDRAARRITVGEIDLVWAPSGPGWPSVGVTWHEAVRRAAHLSADGTTLEPRPRGIWRLPTVQEAVASQHRGGAPSAGSWEPGDDAAGRTSYERRPDKESPLWDPRSQVIYWWTSTEAGPTEAVIIVYDGRTWLRAKDASWGYLGFRAVRTPD